VNPDNDAKKYAPIANGMANRLARMSTRERDRLAELAMPLHHSAPTRLPIPRSATASTPPSKRDGKTSNDLTASRYAEPSPQRPKPSQASDSTTRQATSDSISTSRWAKSDLSTAGSSPVQRKCIHTRRNKPTRAQELTSATLPQAAKVGVAKVKLPSVPWNVTLMPIPS
jgi:hypothetical protein